MSVDYTSISLSPSCQWTIRRTISLSTPCQRTLRLNVLSREQMPLPLTLLRHSSLDSMSVDYTSIYLYPSHNVTGLYVPLPLPTMSVEYTSISLSLNCQWTITSVCLFPPCQWTPRLNVLSREHETATATMYAPPSLDTMSVDYTSIFLSPPCQWTIRPSLSLPTMSVDSAVQRPLQRADATATMYVHLSLPTMPVDYTSLHLSLLTISVDYTSISLSPPCQWALRFNVLSREQMSLPLYIMYVPPSLDIMSVDSAVERFDKSCPGQGRRQEH